MLSILLIIPAIMRDVTVENWLWILLSKLISVYPMIVLGAPRSHRYRSWIKFAHICYIDVSASVVEQL